jgi:hypothetical protein
MEHTALDMLVGAGLEYVLADVLRPEFEAAFEEITRLV